MRLLDNSERATEMDGREDNFDYATQCVFWAMRHLRNHLLELHEDSPDAIACYLAMNKLSSAIDILSPDTNGDWPKDGAKVIPFIPRQRA